MSQPDFRQMNRREIEDFLIEKSLVDPDFRARLISDPRETLRALGVPVSDEVTVNVHVEEPGAFNIVLPRVLRDTDELGSDELDQVSGGIHHPIDQFFRGYM